MPGFKLEPKALILGTVSCPTPPDQCVPGCPVHDPKVSQK